MSKHLRGNAERLASCDQPHRFKAIQGNPYRYVCERCGGEISESEAAWYAVGLNHGRTRCPHCKRRVPTNVCPYCGGDIAK